MRRAISPAILLVQAGLIFFVLHQTVQLASPSTIKIQDATAVRLSLMDTLNSGTNDVDDPVHMEVTEDVKVGDVIVIARGSTATGHVIESEAKKRLGRGGKLSFTVDAVKAVDGTNVRLRASSARKGGEKTGGVVAAAVIVSPLFLLMHGKDVNIPKGTELNAYIDGDREITLGGPPPNSGGPTTGGGAAMAQPAVQSNSKALGKTDILDLLKGEVPSARVTELVKQRGIKFAPTEDDYKEIRAAGGADELINVLKAAALMRE